MAVNSYVFLNLLKKLKCPVVENLEAKDFDWVFQDDSAKEFITSICTLISNENFLTGDEIRRFRSGHGPILQGKYLEHALSGLKTKEEKRFWEHQQSCSKQQLEEYQEIDVELKKQYAKVSKESEKLQERYMESYKTFVCEERKLKEVNTCVKTAKEGLCKQMSQLRELKGDQEPVVLNHYSFDPLRDEMCRFDNDVTTFIKRQASLDFESLLKDLESILCPEDLKDCAGTFDSKSRQTAFQEAIKARYPILLKKYFDQKIENAGLKAEKEKLDQFEKAACSRNLLTTESRLKPEIEVEELEATFHEKMKQLPQIETPYPSKIAFQKSNLELLQLIVAWTMYSKVEDWMSGLLSIVELVDYILRKECNSVDSLQVFLEDFLQHLKENNAEVYHSSDTKLSKDSSEVVDAPIESVNNSFADSTKLFEKVDDALKCAKRSSELVKEDTFEEFKKELDTMKASAKKIHAPALEAKKQIILHEQASRERSQLQTLLDRDLWVYFYEKPEKLKAVAEKFLE